MHTTHIVIPQAQHAFGTPHLPRLVHAALAATGVIVPSDRRSYFPGFSVLLRELTTGDFHFPPSLFADTACPCHQAPVARRS
eukprot:190879-Pyramimonas_sp.AAC.2